MLYPKNIALRWQEVIANIEKSANLADRDYQTINLLAVSKKHPASAIRQLYDLGQKAFGESYLTEALDKIGELSDLAIEWHFIGPIQSNKTKGIAEHFSWVQSVDRIKIAKRLAQQRPQHMAPLNICIQVNLFNETAKSGAMITELPTIAQFISEQPQLKLRGIMAIPPKQVDYAKQQQQFAKIAACYQELKQEFPSLDTLSMGMSGDMQAAIAAGSNCIRIGTALFGERQ